MFNNMTTFNMYVKTLVINEQNKILLLKQKSMTDTPRWDLPGVPLTEDESFDEAVTNNIQKQIGYYLYPGRILGVNDYINGNDKELDIIMETEVLNGELLLDSKYDEFVWIPVNRIADYPLVPWFQNYIKKNKNPFTDVDDEIDKLNEKQRQRREIIQEDVTYERPSRRRFTKDETSTDTTNNKSSAKNSFGLIKDTISKMFHPKEARVTRTQPKENVIYKNEETPTEDIYVEKDSAEQLEQVDIAESSGDIIPDHVIKSQRVEKPEIRKIRETNRPFSKEAEEDTKPQKTIIRKSNESTERVSFNSQRLNRSNWKEKLNNLNKTDANKDKKQAPRPKPRRR